MPKIELPHNHNENVDIIHEYTGQTENFQILSDIFKQLSDSNRLRIFWLLCHCEECVINISAITQMSSPAVSHHLKQLRASDLIVSRRDGKEVYYKVADTKQANLLHSVIENLVEISCPHNK
ncbi:MAG: winged helix-turn-helix transcriptional regulator [Clostridia bacterium]|nr:winged helix-turn-helix transcriptional regulator [Clostridia bacterium]